MKEKIYLIPGLMTDEKLWSKLLPYLEKKYKLIHLPIPKSSNFDVIVEKLLPYFKEEKVNLLGFSLGGYISSYIAIKFPNKIKRLFLVAATPGGMSQKEIERRKNKFEIIKKEGFTGLSYEKTKSLVEYKNDQELIQIIRDMYNNMGKEIFITQLTSTMNRVDISNKMINCNFPIYLYYSKDDRLVNKLSIKSLENKKTNIKVFSRDGTSHNIPLEEPLNLSKLIIKWMNN